MKINSMELVRVSGTTVKASVGSTNMEEKKVSGQPNFQMEESTIVSSRMVSKTVTEFKLTIMEMYIVASLKITKMSVMDS